MKKQKKTLTQEDKERLLYDLLFKQKVEKLGNLNVEQRDGYVVVDKGSNKIE
jgi:hypothetical protein